MSPAASHLPLLIPVGHSGRPPIPKHQGRETHAVSQPASPSGVQTFSQIRQQNLHYVDKTHFAYQLSPRPLREHQ